MKEPEYKYYLQLMTKIKKLFFFLLLFLFTNCSFDTKTGIWSSFEDEERRIARLEDDQNNDLITIYSSEKKSIQELAPTEIISISKPANNTTWSMAGLNLQNYLGNLYLKSIDNKFLRKKVGKNKFKNKNYLSSPLVYENKIIVSDDVGTIFSINQRGKVQWKKNIYKKLYKKINKKLSLVIYKGKIFVSDNIGFIYALNFETGEIIWLKNLEVPLNSSIKASNDKIYIINQDNRILCLDTKTGIKIWDYRSVASFIKLPNLLSTVIANNDVLVALTSSGDLLKLNAKNGRVYWVLSAIASNFAHDDDFFSSSEIVIDQNSVIFSAASTFYSFNLSNGYLNWEANISSNNIPIIDGKNIFTVTENGFFVNIEKNSGKIIWIVNILKILKERKQNTKVSGIVMGSGKIYATTENGYLISSSASTGEVLSFKKIGDNINSNPIISNGSLYILTENSRILGFN
jgi:outer membrane protein assembly factor BamB